MTSYSGRWGFKPMSASPAPAPRCPSLNPPNLYYLIWQKRFFLLMWFWLRIWTWEIIPGCLGGLSLITWVLKSERQQSEWVGDLDKARRGQGELKPLPLLLALKRAGRGPCVRDLWATSFWQTSAESQQGNGDFSLTYGKEPNSTNNQNEHGNRFSPGNSRKDAAVHTRWL